MVDLGNGFWWWAGASSAQLAAGVAACRRGFRGRDTLMPIKAFGVASLFVGAGATAFAGFLYASGIHKVDDMKEVGKSFRKKMRVPPREKNTSA
ncbi:hypothetical protein MRB53_019245 [Persea americana]|uniref:Uncharacterized protein n=1 Tax=Persea americana TaxID=3435 RepID=A0ACC2KXT7_PERAE|nr:hypothetical protein MRB53_019245 [Persea americana]